MRDGVPAGPVRSGGNPRRFGLSHQPQQPPPLPPTVASCGDVVRVRLPNEAVREAEVNDLAVGDELASDVYTVDGPRLAARGQVVTERLLVQLRDQTPTPGLQNPILVIHVIDL